MRVSRVRETLTDEQVLFISAHCETTTVRDLSTALECSARAVERVLEILGREPFTSDIPVKRGRPPSDELRVPNDDDAYVAAVNAAGGFGDFHLPWREPRARRPSYA